jgi:hypothetical protein
MKETVHSEMGLVGLEFGDRSDPGDANMMFIILQVAAAGAETPKSSIAFSPSPSDCSPRQSKPLAGRESFRAGKDSKRKINLKK